MSGSPDDCSAAARQLQRAAAEAARTADVLHRAEVAGWAGAAAQGWERITSERVDRLRLDAAALAAAQRALAVHGEVLRELQARARRLTAEAAQAGLVLDRSGWTGPVPVPEGGSPEELREALHRREVRRRLLAAAEQVRAEEDAAHDRLRRELARAAEEPVPGRACEWGVDVPWHPVGADLPALSVSAAQLAAEVRRTLPAFLRHTGASAGLGFGVGTAVDVQQGRELDDAVTKNILVTGVAVAAGAVTVATAPVAVPVVAVGAGAVAVGAGASWVTGRVFDAVGHRLPWVDRPRSHRPSPSRPVPAGPRPRPVPAPSARPEWSARPRVARPPQPQPQPRAVPATRAA